MSQDESQPGTDQTIRLVAAPKDDGAERRKDLAMTVGVPLAAIGFLALWALLATWVGIVWSSAIVGAVVFLALLIFLGAGWRRQRSVSTAAVRALPKQADLSHRGLGPGSPGG